MKAKRTFLARIQHRVRVIRLNMIQGIQIDHSVYIARSAKIQIDADGCVLGGHVRVSKGVTISDGVIIVPYGGSIEIGARAYIGPYCVLYGHGGLARGNGQGASIGSRASAAKNRFTASCVIPPEEDLWFRFAHGGNA